MRLLGNDRWQATILPDRIGRYEFTIEAGGTSTARFAAISISNAQAGADITVEIAEGRTLLERAKDATQNDVSKVIARPP